MGAEKKGHSITPKGEEIGEMGANFVEVWKALYPITHEDHQFIKDPQRVQDYCNIKSIPAVLL